MIDARKAAETVEMLGCIVEVMKKDKLTMRAVVDGPPPGALRKTEAIPESGDKAFEGVTIAEFKPCRLDMADSGMTQWFFEDVGYVAKPAFPGLYHFIDELRAMDDDRLVGVQFWGPPPKPPAESGDADGRETQAIVTPGNALWELGKARAEIATLRAALEGLREAAVPFADISEPDEGGPWPGHFDRLRTAIAKSRVLAEHTATLAARDAEIATLRGETTERDVMLATALVEAATLRAALEKAKQAFLLILDDDSDPAAWRAIDEAQAAIAGMASSPDPRDEALRLAAQSLQALRDHVQAGRIIAASGVAIDISKCEVALAALSNLKEGRTS